jgi:hypothetical protein
MIPAISHALTSGYPSRVIINNIIRRYPQHAGKIDAALAAGYGADQILQYISGDKDQRDPDKYLTDKEKIRKREDQNSKKALMQLAGTLGTAGALASGVYGYATRNQAIRPNAILPAQRNQPQRALPQQRPGLPPPQRTGIPPGLPPPQPPGPPPQPINKGPSPKPSSPVNLPVARESQKNIDLIHNINEDTRISNILQSSPNIELATQILRKVMPRSKVDILDRVPGGLQQVISDYSKYIQENPPAIREQFQPRQPTEQGIQNREIEQIQKSEEQEQSQNQLQEQEEIAPRIQQIQPEIFKEPINKRVSEAAFGEHEISRIPESKEMMKKNFYIPNYRYPGENVKEFSDRKILFDLINKGAKAITEGKSFLDFLPTSKGVQLSTAADVLRFMGDIPNVYSALLDQEEKQELFDGLLETGDLSVEGLRPNVNLGEGNIHGAQLSPNLIWNLLLTIEPKLQTMKKPPSVKGYKMSPGRKMGGSEIRRFLNHSLYGVLSGKTISSELSDKIQKISEASSNLDIISKAAKAGNLRKIDEYMDKLMDDSYFRDTMDIDLEEILMSSEQKERSEKLAEEDRKMLSSLRAKSERQKKLKSNEINED